MIRTVILACVALLPLCLAPGSAQTVPTPIRIGWAALPPELVPIIFARPDLAHHLGVTYSFAPMRFAASPMMITALAGREVDVAALTYFSFAAAVQNAKLTDLRIIADEFQDGAEGYGSSGFFVRKDGGIDTLKDVAGKIVATMGTGSASDLGAKMLLLGAGMKANRDYTTIEARPATMASMLLEKKVDLIAGPIALGYDPRIQQAAKRLATVRDAIGKSQVGLFVVRQGFIDAHRAALVDFYEDWLRATRWFIDPANHAAAVAIVAAYLKTEDASLDWMFTEQDVYRDPRGEPDLVALAHSLSLLKDQGLLASAIDLDRYRDLSIIHEAAERLR